MDSWLTERDCTQDERFSPASAEPELPPGRPPDLLHDIALDFVEIGWQVSVVGWRAVVSAAEEDASAPHPEWPTEITLSEVRRDGHAAGCAAHLTPTM